MAVSHYVLAFLLSVLGAKSDLPVHCLRHQIYGEWSFKLGALSPKRSSCGHRSPDVEEVQPQGVEGPSETKRIELSRPNVATTPSGSRGTFTMIYDEGFEVQVDNLHLFAFSRFDLVGEGSGKKNASRCGDTARGWYRNANRTLWGCYAASKVHKPISLLSLAPTLLTPHSASLDIPLPREWHEDRVYRLNTQQEHWHARVYDRFVGLSLRQLNSIAGIRRGSDHEGRQRRQRPALLELGQSSCPEAAPPRRPKQGDLLSHLLVQGQKAMKPCQLRNQFKVYDQPADPAVLELERRLPKLFTWADVGNKSFLEPVMDQGSCGSCYIVSTMRMLTARHKIRTNNPSAEPWSISFPLHCSEYNQGCKGGYGFLAMKWSEDVGLVPASCAPYSTEGTCQMKCDRKQLGKRYHATNHHYVGSFYGNSSTASMMEELHKSGPVVVSFEPTEDFMFYGGGIFGQSFLGVPAPLDKHGAEWVQVDHAVLLVGWGEDLGQKYWLVQNSWGDTWGEAGFFRIVRGIDDSGIESIAVAADVVEDGRPEVLEGFLDQLPVV